MDVRDGLLDLIAKNPRRPIEHDEEWDSPCRVGHPDDDGMITWQPVAIDSPPDFSAIEEILGGPMHPDAKATTIAVRYRPSCISRALAFIWIDR